MNNADNGENSPGSGTAAPVKPQRSGRKRRRWRSKKKRVDDTDAGSTTALSGTDTRNDNSAHLTHDGEPRIVDHFHSSKTSAEFGNDPARGRVPESDTAIDGLGIRKKARRKRNKQRSKNHTTDQNCPAASQNKQNSSSQARYRRQPMAQEKSATFNDAPDDKTSNQNRKYKHPAAGHLNDAKTGNFHNPNRPAFHQKQSRKFYAALDLGTNNCRLLVAVPQGPGRFRVVDAFSRIVRLGEGLGSSGELSDAAMDRTIDALKVCRDKLDQRTHTRHRLIATEACRRARNGPEFLARVKQEAGLDLEIVDRATEARLAVSGCGSLVDHKAHGVVLFDIGGGSSELALLDISKRRSRRLSDHIKSWASLPLGVVTLSEKFGGGKNVSPQIFEDMVAEVARMLDQFEGRDALSHLLENDRFHLLGTSGTVTTLAGVHLNLRRYDRRRVDGTWLSDQEVDAMISRILSMSFEDRVNNPCIGADRADLVLAGCAILEAIRRLWPSPRLRVADRGLREGLLTEMMAEDGVWRRNRKKPARQHNSRDSRNN